MHRNRISALFAVLLVALFMTLLLYVGLGGVYRGAGYTTLLLITIPSIAIFSFILFAIHRFGARR